MRYLYVYLIRRSSFFSYANDVIMLSKSRARLQRLLNKRHDFCTSSNLEVNLSKTKIMILGRNKRKLNQEAFYLDKDQIKITHEYKYLGIDLYSHSYFEPSSKRWRLACLKALMGTLKKEVIVGVTCWELKCCFQLSHMALKFGEETWKTLIGRLLRRAWKYFIMSHIQARSSTTYHNFIAQIWRTPHRIMRS